MTATRAELVHQLAKRHNISAELVDPEPGFAGVNVWASDTDRYPWSTVWWPTDPPRENETDYVFGPAFQYSAKPTLSAAELADQVAETMKTSVAWS